MLRRSKMAVGRQPRKGPERPPRSISFTRRASLVKDSDTEATLVYASFGPSTLPAPLFSSVEKGTPTFDYRGRFLATRPPRQRPSHVPPSRWLRTIKCWSLQRTPSHPLPSRHPQAISLFPPGTACVSSSLLRLLRFLHLDLDSSYDLLVDFEYYCSRYNSTTLHRPRLSLQQSTRIPSSLASFAF
jgi:hypothetical protein